MNTKKFKQIPLDGWAGLKQNFSADAMSGFMVFMLALPLSIGIAKASDFPPIYGLVTAIIGGVIVSFFSGSLLSIKGPAAGLIVIASGAVTAFGGEDKILGWHYALAAITIAGLVQIVFGLLKFGKFSDYFPGAAIHGMLAAIGIIIMSKQIHFLVGINPVLLKGKEPLELIAMIPNSLVHENPHLAEIGLACLAVLVLLSYVKNRHIKKIPPPMIVLAIAIPLGLILHLKTDGEVSNYALVSVGNIIDVLKENPINVNFSGLNNNLSNLIQYVVLFALIGSIESLLTVKALDGMDPYKRHANPNKDLLAIGIGNTLSGIIGGLPMISEVARSSANVINGAKTRWANFFHGLFLLLSLILAVPFINMIPNAALAAMLIFVGFKLAHPKEFKHVWHVGKDQFIIFIVTIFLTLATDLLIGVLSGIALEIIVNFFHGAKFKGSFSTKGSEIVITDDMVFLVLAPNTVFTNILGLKRNMDSLPRGTSVCVDFSKTHIVDHTSMLAIHKFAESFTERGGQIKFIGNEHLQKTGLDKDSTRKINKLHSENSTSRS
jgi:MFS superfamily sulfate permease-like transporter